MARMDDHVGFETACQLVLACYDFVDGPSSIHLVVLVVNPSQKPEISQWDNVTLAVRYASHIKGEKNSGWANVSI